MKRKITLLEAIVLSTSFLLPTFSFAQKIAAGGFHSLAVCSDSTARGWGYNVIGQLGDGTTVAQRITPVPVTTLTGIVAVAGGGDHSLFVKSDGTVWASGGNDYGQL